MDPKQVRILAIEDNLGDVLLIQEALNARGIKAQLQVTIDGEQAIQMLDDFHPAAVPNLCIIDLNLPRIGGLEILEHLRKLDKFARTKVIVLTSSRSPDDRVEAERLGANAFVSKPLTLDDFLENIGAAVERLIAEPPAHHARLCVRNKSRQSSRRSTPARRHIRAQPKLWRTHSACRVETLREPCHSWHGLN